MTEIYDVPTANFFQNKTSAEKMAGQFYTPASLVEIMLAELAFSADDYLLDPACGDGSFLCTAVYYLAQNSAEEDFPQLAKKLTTQLIGFDIDAEALKIARGKLQEAFLLAFNIKVNTDDFLLFNINALRYPSLADLCVELELPISDNEQRLLIIGNPPYVESKRLSAEVKNELKLRFPDAVSGAADLCLYFLQLGLGWLRPGDALAFVLPNKILVTKNAQLLREYLLENKLLTGISFATKAKIFGNVAVYPIILYAQGGTATEVMVNEITRSGSNLCSSSKAALPHAAFQHSEISALFPWPFSAELGDLLSNLLVQRDRQRLKDICDIRWAVSFHRAGLREQFITRDKPDSPYARKIIGGGAFSGNGEVTRYRVSWAGWWIDYHIQKLYELKNQLPPAEIFQAPKIIICQNSRTLRCAYDESGLILKDTFLCGLINQSTHPLSQHPRAIVGILNSGLIHFFFSHLFFGGHKNGGYLHFLSTYLIDIPLGEWNNELAARLSALVEQRENATVLFEQQKVEEDIDAIVRQAFSLSIETASALQEWLQQDENWRLKERINKPEIIFDQHEE